VVRVHNCVLAEDMWCHQQLWWWSKFVDSNDSLVNINNSGYCGIVYDMYGWLQCYDFSVTCMLHTTLQARCAIVEPTAMMHVQNYAGTRVKRGSCWKCSTGWRAVCLHYLHNSLQHFNWNRALCGCLDNSLDSWRHK